MSLLNRVIKKIHTKLRHKLYPCPITFTIKDGDTAEQVVDRVSKITDDRQFFDAVGLLSVEWVTTDALLNRHDIWDRVTELWRNGFRHRVWESADDATTLAVFLGLEPNELS